MFKYFFIHLKITILYLLQQQKYLIFMKTMLSETKKVVENGHNHSGKPYISGF